jgi:hypothetical protein
MGVFTGATLLLAFAGLLAESLAAEEAKSIAAVAQSEPPSPRWRSRKPS